MFSMVIGLLVCLIVMAVYLALGRVVAAHVGCGSMVTPFRAMFTGLGLWYLWTLVFHITLGVNLDMTWFTFFVSAIVLAIVLTKAHAIETEKIRLFWVQVLLALALLAPVLLLASFDVPTKLYEFLDTLNNAQVLADTKNLPEGGTYQALGYFAPEQPQLLQIMAAPFSLMYGKLPEAIFTILNLLILASLTGAVSRTVGVELNGKNVVIATVLALLGLTLFNPVFDDSLLLSANYNWLTAALFFAVLTPALMSEPIVKWVSVLPSAFIAIALVGVHENGLYLFGFAYFVWIVRSLAEYKGDPKSLIGLLALFVLPVSAVFAWESYTLEQGMGFAYARYNFDIANVSSAVSALISVMMYQPLTMFLVAVIIYALVKDFAQNVRGMRTFSEFLREKSYLWVPACAFLFYFVYVSVMAATQHPEVAKAMAITHLQHIQFLLLVPLWRYLVHLYADKLDLKGWLSQMPTRVSVIAIAVFVGLVFINRDHFTDTQSAPVEHTIVVAKDIEQRFKSAQKIAVLDKTNLAPLYASILQYGLQRNTIAESVAVTFYEQTTQIEDFHKALVADRFDYLWVHVPDTDVQTRIDPQLMADHSYLFRVTPTYLQFVAKYPHLAYQQSFLNTSK